MVSEAGHNSGHVVLLREHVHTQIGRPYEITVFQIIPELFHNFLLETVLCVYPSIGRTVKMLLWFCQDLGCWFEYSIQNEYFYASLLFILAEIYCKFLWNRYETWKCWGNWYDEYLKCCERPSSWFYVFSGALMINTWTLQRKIWHFNFPDELHPVKMYKISKENKFSASIMKGGFGTNPVTHWGPFQVFSFCLPWFISSSVLFTAACGMCSFMFVNAEFYLLHSSLISEETQFLFLFTHFV